MTTNEAAERLRLFVYANANRDGMNDEAGWMKDIDEALAAERRATVERIRERLKEAMRPYGKIDDLYRDEILEIVDQEAVR
jgi:hypothetical protein